MFRQRELKDVQSVREDGRADLGELTERTIESLKAGTSPLERFGKGTMNHKKKRLTSFAMISTTKVKETIGKTSFERRRKTFSKCATLKIVEAPYKKKTAKIFRKFREHEKKIHSLFGSLN